MQVYKLLLNNMVIAFCNIKCIKMINMFGIKFVTRFSDSGTYNTQILF